MSGTVRVIGLGVLSAVLFGGTMALVNSDPWAGVVGGLVYGVVMAVLMRRVWGSRALEGLTRGQRRHVLRTMRRGETMDDERLARPLVEQANALLAVPYPAKLMRTVFALAFVLGATLVILNVADGEVPRASGVLLAVFSLVFLLVVVPMNIRQRERIARSKDATESRWGQHPTGSQPSGLG